MAEKDNNKIISKESELTKEQLFILLQNFSNLRTGQDQVLWSILGAFWTANSLLLVSIFTSDKQNMLLVGLLISLVGICISWIWNHIQSRALSRIELYEKSIISIEKRLNLELEFCAFLQANTDEYLKRPNKKAARLVMRQFSKYTIYVWGIAATFCLIYFLVVTFCTCQ